ncbi:hypothetical protein ACFO5Q_04635 [Kordiimonas lipolytica]|uniref:Uncharacterized protein n=1 Tax=Kordiimonas lipolytica TaxID=1662421 RepID=A0ABV8U7E6_9PROT|nr:hypothetical protein [Kordiimonas lipolytica]
MTAKKPTNYKLKLQFDGDQISNALLYEFEDGGKNAMTKEGRYSGCIQFKAGDTIDVEVTMTATPGELRKVSGMQPISLDLVSVPNVNQDFDSFSPFDRDQVTKCLVGSWSEPQHSTDPSTGISTWVSNWRGAPVEVVAEKGFWQLAGFLGIAIYQNTGGDEVRIARVLSFDPETTSGDGSDPV